MAAAVVAVAKMDDHKKDKSKKIKFSFGFRFLAVASVLCFWFFLCLPRHRYLVELFMCAPLRMCICVRSLFPLVYCEHIMANRLQKIYIQTHTYINAIISKCWVSWFFGSCFISGSSPCVPSILIQFSRKKMKMKKQQQQQNPKERARLERWWGADGWRSALEMPGEKLKASNSIHFLCMCVFCALMRRYFVERFTWFFGLPFLFRLCRFSRPSMVCLSFCPLSHSVCVCVWALFYLDF